MGGKLDQKSPALKILITAGFTQALQLAHNSRGRSHFGSIEIFSSDNRDECEHARDTTAGQDKSLDFSMLSDFSVGKRIIARSNDA